MLRVFSTAGKMVLAIIWLPLLLWLFKDQIMGWIRETPTLATIYDFSYAEIANKTALGAGILQFFANLVFIMFLPKYIMFGYFLKSGMNDHVLLVACCAIGMFCAMCVNFLFGVCFGFVGRWFWRESLEKFGLLLSRYGCALILIGYLFPLGFPCTLLSFICGASHFSPRKFLLCTAIGCPVYFAILLSCQNWLMGIYEKANFLF